MNCSQAQGFLQWLKIRKLYKKAFPRAERKPLSIIKAMQKSQKSDVWFFEKDGKFAGFAATINGDEITWYDSTILREDGYFYLVDDCDMKVQDITDKYCWFKGRTLKYHVMPDA